MKIYIPFLVDHFLLKYSKRQKFQISPEAMEILLACDWPGNVRELENTIERATVISPEPMLTPDFIHPLRAIGNSKPEKSMANSSQPIQTLEQVERDALERALEQAGGNQTKAAKILDIPRHVLIYRMKKLNIVS